MPHFLVPVSHGAVGRRRQGEVQLGGVRMAPNPLDLNLMLISCTLWFGLRHGDTLGRQRQDAVGPPGAKRKAAPPKWGRKQQNGDAGDLSWGWAHSEGEIFCGFIRVQRLLHAAGATAW